MAMPFAMITAAPDTVYDLAQTSPARTMPIQRITLLILLLMLLPATAISHHSRAAYDSNNVTIVEGGLVDVRWRNPHIVFTLRVTGEDGSVALWRMEAGSIYMLKRAGLCETPFKTGARVKVAGYLSKSEARDFLANSMLFADGKEILTMPNAEPYWTDDRFGAQDQWVSDTERLRSVSAPRQDIFQVWSIPRSGGRISKLPFTKAAIAARAQWDMIDNPLTRCEQPGLPRIMTNPHPFEFIDEGNTIVLLGEEFDMVRTIHLDASATPETVTPSNLGYSVAHWDGNSLVVETTHINWPYFDGIGTPQSEAVTMLERYTPSDNHDRLDFHYTITDPATFSRPATYEGYWLALGESVEKYECVVY